MNAEQRKFVLEMLWDLEQQINEGEYYSYDRDDFNEHVATAKKLYNIDYYREKGGLL